MDCSHSYPQDGDAGMAAAPTQGTPTLSPVTGA
ncbi:hypothetical protein QTP70_031917, partial [Hemibagrus guttatus]